MKQASKHLAFTSSRCFLALTGCLTGSLMAPVVAPAQAQSEVPAPVGVEPAPLSRLTGVSLPKTATRVQKEELNTSVTRVLKKLSSQSNMDCAQTEVLMWGDDHFGRAQADGIIKNVDAQLKKAGYTYQDFGTQTVDRDVMTIFMLQRPKQMILGYWQTSDDFLMLGWCELVPPAAKPVGKPVAKPAAPKTIKPATSVTPKNINTSAPDPAASGTSATGNHEPMPLLPAPPDGGEETITQPGGWLAPMPVGSAPVNPAPVGSAPVGAAPINSAPHTPRVAVKPVTSSVKPHKIVTTPEFVGTAKPGEPPFGTYECLYRDATGWQRSLLGDVRLLSSNDYDAYGARGRYTFDMEQKRIIWQTGALRGLVTFFKTDDKGRPAMLFPHDANEKLKSEMLDATDTWGQLTAPGR